MRGQFFESYDASRWKIKVSTCNNEYHDCENNDEELKEYMQ